MEKLKHVKAIWDAAAHRVFLDVCIEEVNKNNRPVQVLNNTGYANLVKNFNTRTKRNYDRKKMKNRWDRAICDFDMRFTFAVTGWPGSVHDTCVWTDAQPRFTNYPHPPPGNAFAYVVCTHNISTKMS
jgi:hypothetical protein